MKPLLLLAILFLQISKVHHYLSQQLVLWHNHGQHRGGLKEWQQEKQLRYHVKVSVRVLLLLLDLLVLSRGVYGIVEVIIVININLSEINNNSSYNRG